MFNREEWLKTLKKGDKVANKTREGFSGQKAYQFLEVKNITAKGNIRLTNGILLNENGYYYKYENWNSCTYDIEPITDEIIEYEKNRKEYNSIRYEVGELCSSFRRKTYALEDLKLLKELLGKGKQRD